MSNLATIETPKLDKILKAFDSVNQPKSDFQIQHFVVGQHDTPERQYVQCVIQLHALVNNIKLAEINRQRTLLDIAALKKKKSARKQLDLEEKLIQLDNIEFSMKGALREFNCFYKILESFGEGFSYEQIQKAELTYWPIRLARQSQCDIEAHGRVGTGNLEAMWQAGLRDNPAQTFLANNKGKLKELCQG